MVITEHMRGTLYIPKNVGGDTFEIIEYNFTEDDIIQDACSITSRCCDDSTLSIGGVRPAELSIRLRIEISGVNAYTLYGAKIRLYSIYASADDAEEVLRGEFWVTSVSRTKTVYTLRASDALVWLDSGAYDVDSTTTSSEEDNPIYIACSSSITTLAGNVNLILDYVNKCLTSMQIDTIPYDTRVDIPNNQPDGIGYALLPVSVAGTCSSRAPRDYLAYAAQIFAGCVQMITDPDNPSVRKLYCTPYWYTPTANCTPAFQQMWDNCITISYECMEDDGCDIADYTLYIQRTHMKTYDDWGWSNYSGYLPYRGNLTIDISGNAFVDGRRYNYSTQKPDAPLRVLIGIGEQLAKHSFRPFAIKAHVQFAKAIDYPKLGQRIRMQDADGTWQESMITKMVWTFRGGWEFGCAGKDTRVLSQAAKSSLAKHAEESAKTYAKIVANNADSGIAEARQEAATANANANAVLDAWNTQMPSVWERLDALEAKG